MNKSKKITISAFLIALDILFSRFFVFYTPDGLNRLSLQFLPNAITGYIYAPVWSGIVLACADLLGALINTNGASIHLGFTLSAFVKGFLYSYLLHKKEPTMMRVLSVSLLVNIIVDLILNPLWLSHLYGDSYFVTLMAKVPVRMIWVIISSTIIYAVIKTLKPALKKQNLIP